MDTTSAAYRIMQALIKAAIFLLFAFAFLGNSTWHNQAWAIVSIVIIIVGIALTNVRLVRNLRHSPMHLTVDVLSVLFCRQ